MVTYKNFPRKKNGTKIFGNGELIWDLHVLNCPRLNHKGVPISGKCRCNSIMYIMERSTAISNVMKMSYYVGNGFFD